MTSSNASTIPFTPALEALIAQMADRAERDDDFYIGTVHLLDALCRQDANSRHLLEKAGILEVLLAAIDEYWTSPSYGTVVFSTSSGERFEVRTVADNPRKRHLTAHRHESGRVLARRFNPFETVATYSPADDEVQRLAERCETLEQGPSVDGQPSVDDE